MHSIVTRLAAVSVAVVVAASMVGPASAATKHKHTAAPVQAAPSADMTGLAPHPDWSPVPAAAYQTPNSCVSDEGYGRYSSCDQSGGL